MLSSRPLLNIPSFFSPIGIMRLAAFRVVKNDVLERKQMRVKEWQGNKRPLVLGYRAIKYQINECDCCKERATRSFSEARRDRGRAFDARREKQAMNCQSQRLIDVE